MNDPFDLERFVLAQGPLFTQVREELRLGEKHTHWMWFVFPQLKGLGHSPMAARYGIASLDEAKAFLAHPLLGPRLRECTQMVNEIEGRSATEIFGYPDDVKFRSSMTLFASAAANPAPFIAALEKYFGGQRDPLTMELLHPR